MNKQIFNNAGNMIEKVLISDRISQQNQFSKNNEGSQMSAGQASQEIDGKGTGQLETREQYQAPSLERLGSVAELTASTGGGTGSDSGGYS